jgi:hypothetical protein
MALIATTERRRADELRFLHDDGARSLQALDKPLGDNPRRDLSSVMFPLAAVEAQRKSQSVGEVIGGGGRQAQGREPQRMAARRSGEDAGRVSLSAFASRS